MDVSHQLVTPRCIDIRIREKAHLAFVAAQPCYACGAGDSGVTYQSFRQPARKSVEAVSLTSGFTEALLAVLCTFPYAGKSSRQKA